MQSSDSITTESVTQAHFEQHLRSMSRFASLLLSELRGPATRLLYDAEFIGRAACRENDPSLRETFVDVQGSSQDLQRWVQRLARFVDQGVRASEHVMLGDLLGLAIRASAAGQRGPLTEVVHDHPEASLVTNVVLASELLAELIQAVEGYSNESRVRIVTNVTRSGGVAIQLSPQRPHVGWVETSVRRTLLGKGRGCPSAFDVMVRTAGVLGATVELPRANAPWMTLRLTESLRDDGTEKLGMESDVWGESKVALEAEAGS